MTTPAVINRGWTNFSVVYHKMDDFGVSFRLLRHCDNGIADQTERRKDGEATGALVPTDLRPCKRCFPSGDA